MWPGRWGPTVAGQDRLEAGLTVTGTGGQVPSAGVRVDARLSGTTARFTAPVLALGAGTSHLDGSEPLRRRPMGPTVEALRALGAEVDEEGAPGHLPLRIRGGALRSGPVALDGSTSSQFASGLLLAAPCFPSGLDLELTGALVSAPYLDMTIAAMAEFGARVDRPEARRLVVAPGGYRATEVTVEPDASGASYLFAAAAICGGRVRVEGLGRPSLQGDLAFVGVLEQMGAEVIREPAATEVRVAGPLRGVDVDLADLPDTAQTLAAVAVFARGATRVRGVGFIRFHETDRLAAVVTELRRAGIDAEETEDGFVVRPGTPRPAVIQTYDDHRMAMSFALLGLRAPGIAIADPGCVAKTFPAFWDVLDQVRSSSPAGD